MKAKDIILRTAIKARSAKRSRSRSRSRSRRRQRINNNNADDRLSSLPDEILIDIISRLPILLAINTGSLSRRWHGLWTNRTSMHLTSRNFFTKFVDIMTRITSPVIHSFSLELLDMNKNRTSLPSIEAGLRQICERNVRQLNLNLSIGHCSGTKYDFPSVVLRTQSLVSLTFGSTRWKLPESINLPNLRNLTLDFCPSDLDWLEKLTEACPLLEQLSLNYEHRHEKTDFDIKISIRSLRRLFINFKKPGFRGLVMNCPMIEYLSVNAPLSLNCSFEEAPIALRKANLEITGSYLNNSSKKEFNNDSSKKEFYDVISKVDALSLRVFSLDKRDNVPEALFQRVTHLTIDKSVCGGAKAALPSFLEICPTLRVLIVECIYYGYEREYESWRLPKPSQFSTLRQSLRRIELIVDWHAYNKSLDVFFEFVEYFLRESTYLEQFKVDVTGIDYDQIKDKEGSEVVQRSELMFCNRLYNCHRASIECEVEFVGFFFKMSRKAGPNAVNVHGNVFPLTSD